jgi:predicted DCC family thiol-disulfide oxidoreductase YuxK
MKRLYVLFDQECTLCQRCCHWLSQQPAFIELQFVPLQSPDVVARFPGIEAIDLRERLVVISDEGAVYQGQYAWIMCLYALRDYRTWSQRLAQPALLPFAQKVCELVSKHRLAISGFLNDPVDELTAKLQRIPAETCRVEGSCH